MIKARQSHELIGIDLGGTQVRVGRVVRGKLHQLVSAKINNQGSEDEVMQSIFNGLDELGINEAEAIGIGVPSVVDAKQGIVYDVQNIPSWKEVPVKQRLADRYGLPVMVNNDANCMALAEYYFGAGKGADHMAGLIVGTGLAVGLVINGQLYEGAHCGAGEIGMLPYLDHHYEYYCSGQFFQNQYGLAGEQVYAKAMSGDSHSIAIFEAFGHHLGHAVMSLLYTYDPGLIVLGGSVGQAYPLYKEALWHVLGRFAYQNILKSLKIATAAVTEPGVIGAAALCYNHSLKS